MLDNLPDIDEETGEVVGGDQGGIDPLSAMPHAELCALVRQLRTQNADLVVRAKAAEMESAHFRKRLEVTKQKLVNVSTRRRGAAVGDKGQPSLMDD